MTIINAQLPTINMLEVYILSSVVYTKLITVKKSTMCRSLTKISVRKHHRSSTEPGLVVLNGCHGEN
jgi:hypothetical protein